jgi:uncharacterized protein (TIGR03382 family)
MKLLCAAAAVSVATAVALYAPATHACTNPEKGAGTPTVTGDNPSGTTGGGVPGGVNETGTGTPGTTGGTTGTTGTTNPSDPGAINETGTATPNSGEVLLNTEFIEVGWTAGREVDSDPNLSGYWNHSGHRISTRIQVKDATTQEVVFEETVPQYNYASATKGGTNPTVLRTETRLDPGRYEVRVQSVFSRHNEVRYGLDGSWQSTTAPAPAIKTSEPAAKIIIPAGTNSTGPVAGGCNTSSAELLQGLSALVLLALSRRRFAR